MKSGGMGAYKTNQWADKPLGQILLEKCIISQKQLDAALEKQKIERGKYIGQILMEMGVPQDEINKALDSYNKRKRIGEILIDAKVITPSQLAEALSRQKEQQNVRKPLGKILMEMGYVTYDEYMNALSKHFTMKIVSLKGFTPSKSLQKSVGENYALKKKIVVLQNANGKIKLALAEPNIFFMEEMQKLLPFGKRMEFYLARSAEIEPCLGKLYPSSLAPGPTASPL
jgi:hypothetical protein